jgi:hypothetical protein
MVNPKKSLEEKIKSVRKQIIALDSKREVLEVLLEKLENQRLELTGVQYYQQGEPTSISTVEYNNKGYSSLFRPFPVKEGEIPYKISISDENVQLFISLFKGRADVYAKRWENRQGRSGYSPSCRNEWVREICRKPYIRCSECDYRELIPFTEEIVRGHLSGKTTVGVYPLLADETCNFMAVDFDKKDWQEDVNSFARTCREKGIECAVERSRSGEGAHVWFFFECPALAG